MGLLQNKTNTQMQSYSLPSNKLIVGLGNVGKKYAKNRHNAGFMAVNMFADRTEANWREEANMNAYLAILDNEKQETKIYLAKPTTMMNDSGRALSAIANYYKINPEDILVVSDDIDRNFGQLRTRLGGGSGGHKGLESIINIVGEDFRRLRIGVSNEHRSADNAPEFVLKNFSKDESAQLAAVFESASLIIQSFLDGNFQDQSLEI